MSATSRSLVVRTDFPDGLSASIFGTFDQPILLTEAAALPAATQAELDRLTGSATTPGTCSNGTPGAGFVRQLNTTVVGGPSVISSTQKELLDTYGTSTRVAGANRYETAIAVATAFDALAGDVSEVLLATGANFPDALAGGVLAQQTGAPILLNDGDTVRADVAAFLLAEDVQKVTILGGTTAVPASVEAELKGALGIPTVTRLAGDNRSATAVAVANAINPPIAPSTTPLWPGGTGLTVVNGFNFPDALTAAPLAFQGGLAPSPILLTAATAVPAPTVSYHQTWCNDVAFIDAIGGTTVISADVVTGCGWCRHVLGSRTSPRRRFVNSGQIQAGCFALGGGFSVTADAGTAADGAAANAWQVALIQNALVTPSVVIDPEGNNNVAYGGLPTFIMTANFAGMTDARLPQHLEPQPCWRPDHGGDH